MSASYNLYFMPEPKKCSLLPRKYLNIGIVIENLGESVSEHLIFARVILGCDTISRLFRIEKPVGLALLKDNDIVCQQAVELKSLPQEKRSRAAQYHSFRVFIKFKNGNETNWGWRMTDGRMTPIHSNLDSLSSCTLYGWDTYDSTNSTTDLKSYYERHSELSIQRGIRVIISSKYGERILAEIRIGHLGIDKMKSKARCYVY
ncbi:hypothetical protein LSH36_650g01076 [Paralvinella palmiformis]|uniref:Uncharacterized protein n=1 Tax=Paralvinella palmiformis TaxID=53620 RepID=A0AAD9J3T4_9ANNE|nr:hypothetical protein LSH36_650g01076 [Paralvinella palmiformis]